MESEYYDAPEEPRVPPKNGLGLAGFIVSLVGIVTCGLTAPIGLIMSLVALKGRPKGLAIAGAIIGFVGCLEAVGSTFLFMEVGKQAKAMIETTSVLATAQRKIEERYDATNEIPSREEGEELLADIVDGWGNEIQYEPGDSGYTIRSAGPDTVFGTPDDLPRHGSFLEDR